MMRLMLILMVATGVSACTAGRSGMASLPGDASEAFAVCKVACGLTQSDVLAFVQHDLDAVMRSAPF